VGRRREGRGEGTYVDEAVLLGQHCAKSEHTESINPHKALASLIESERITTAAAAVVMRRKRERGAVPSEASTSMDGTVGGMRKRSRRQSAYAAASTSSGHQKAMVEPRHRHLLSRVRGERGSVRLLRTATARLHLIREEAKKKTKVRNPAGPDRIGRAGLSTLPPPPLH
jgi:hypothetical protein